MLRCSSEGKIRQALPRFLSLSGILCFLILPLGSLFAQAPQPLVAIHDSELTRALETTPASGATPIGPGTTGFQWWPTDWHYFVMPESLKEALTSDGTAATVVNDAGIASGQLLLNGAPRYPIVFSLAAEAIQPDEIAQLTNYVAAGGFLFVGSSSFTRNPDGTSLGDFAFAQALGVHMVNAGLANWGANNTFTKVGNHRLTGHIPGGQMTWRMPSASEEIPWGTSPGHPFLAPHDTWQVQAAGDAVVLATGDNLPYLVVKPFGKGYFIYNAAFQPLIGHSGFAPSTYSYVIFRRAIEWAFETSNLAVPKLSPWPYSYDAAFIIRHDLENFQGEIAHLEASALVEYTNGARGDYYFCTGTLREEMGANYNTNDVIAGLRRAVMNYGATIGPHNGGLKNPNNPGLVLSDYDYWHWGPDEALDTTPPGYPDGKTYAFTSISNSFMDIEGWLAGLNPGVRAWAGCYFNATRESSYDIQEKLNVKIAGEQKLTPFPHWTLSTQTTGKRYDFLSEPVSDWFVNGLVAQSLEPWHAPGVQNAQTLHDAIDFYYNLGGLINFYSHSLSTGEGDAGTLVPEYLNYSLNRSLHPNIWSANALSVYNWWLQRSNAQITATAGTSGSQTVTTVTVSGAGDPATAIELLLPNGAISALSITTNGIPAGPGGYRINGQTLKVLVGTSVNSVVVRYTLGPRAQDDFYSAVASSPLAIGAAIGVLSNDVAGAAGGTLIAQLVTSPSHGSLTLNADGGFTYMPFDGFTGMDSFIYAASAGPGSSSPATVTLLVRPVGAYFYDDFNRPSDPGTLTPWVAQFGVWQISGGVLRGGTDPLESYGYAYTENWTDYSVQGRIQFPAGAFGGGLGGRLNPTTGAHYAAWIYPEGTIAPTAVLRLVKFHDWTSWSYNSIGSLPMQEATLPSVGTGWHTVKLAFKGNQIAVYFDGTQMMSVADTEPQPWLSGGISADMWTELSPYTMLMDEVLVSPLVSDDRFVTPANTALTVPAPGVLANDTPAFGKTLTAAPVTGPAHGTLSLNPDGSFTYNPTTGFYGTDSFVYQDMDGAIALGSATVNIVVDHPPKPVPMPGPTIVSSSFGADLSLPLVAQCGMPTNLFVSVMGTPNNPLTIIWTLNGVPKQTNHVAAAAVPVETAVGFTARPAFGASTLSVSVSDGFSPTVQQTYLIAALDTKPPVPDAVSLPILSGQCSVSVASAPTATDACAGSIKGVTVDPLVYSLPGTYTVHWIFADGNGNASMQPQTVMVKDTMAPSLACPPDVVVTNGAMPPFCTFTRAEWAGAPNTSFAGAILTYFFGAIYNSGVVEVGIVGTGGYSAKFTTSTAVRTCLGNAGTVGALTADVTNPTSTPAGQFAAQVLALRLNIDFGDAGASVGLLGSIGNLVFSDPASPLNGKTVREILSIANTALGGGNISSLGIGLTDLNGLLDNLNQASDGCQVSAWATTHLLPANIATAATGRAVATDNCDSHPIVTYSDTVTAGVCRGSYTVARTWKAIDATGNSSACTQMISVLGSTASVCGSVLLDCGGTGNLTGAAGLPGCLVVLKNTSGVVVASTTTDSDGSYCFSGLVGTAYLVTVTPPANYRESVDPDGVKDNQTVVSLSGCQSRTGINFAYTGTMPALTLTQLGPSAAKPGATVTFNFAVTNTGNTCFTGGLTVTDPLLGGLIFSRSPVAPGQGFTFSVNYVVKATDPASLTSAATATGSTASGPAASSQANCIVAILAAPATLSGTPGNAKVTLTWSGVTGATSYNVKRATSVGGPFANVITGVTTTTWTDSSVANGTVYYYQVSAVKSGVEGAASVPITVIPSAGLPSPWATKDVGSVAAAGGVSYTSPTFSLIGSGNDIWDGVDEFRYVYQLASGDCTIVARVVNVQATDPWSKAGVMIRESLNADSRHASVFLTPGNGVAFQSRSSTGGLSSNVNTTGLVGPYWVKVVRSGNLFTCYRSATGATWTSMGSQTITMSSSVYIGLAVTSHSDGALCTASFDNVTATP